MTSSREKPKIRSAAGFQRVWIVSLGVRSKTATGAEPHLNSLFVALEFAISPAISEAR